MPESPRPRGRLCTRWPREATSAAAARTLCGWARRAQSQSLAVCELAHPGCGAVGVTEDDACTRVVAARPGTDVVCAPKSEETLSARARHRHAAQALAQLG
eukprot:176280-Pleurochrysis_carterae.AAC.1